MIRYTIIKYTNGGCYDLFIGGWLVPSKDYIIIKHGTMSQMELQIVLHKQYICLWFTEQNNVYTLDKRLGSKNHLVTRFVTSDIKWRL